MNKSKTTYLPTSTRYLSLCVGLAAVLCAAAVAHAGIVTMTAGDGFGASSFNSAGTWDNGLAPSAGNDYFNATYLLRTPASGNASFTFAGDSLTITGSGLATAVNNESLMWKGSGTGAIITVNNLTINGGQLRHGQGDADSFTLAGNVMIGANNANFATQGGMIIAAPIAGTSTIRILDSGNTDARRLVTFASGANAFTGNLQLAGSAANRARIALADDANWNFVIGASGVNNSISGIGTATFNGDFNFDLTGASSTWGSTWNIVSVSTITETFGSTFTVAGWTDMGSYWTTSANGTTYSFDEITGVLAIPEPSTGALLLGGLGLLLGLRRRA